MDNKITRKFKLLFIALTFIMTQSLFAEMTICHKKEWTKPSTIEFTQLDGGKCEGDYSLKQMKKKGWFIKDIKIETSGNGLDYIYYLTDINPISIRKYQIAKNMRLEKIDLKQTLLKVTQVNNGTAMINMGNLKIGQSGIIEHTYKDGNQIIVSSAYVMESNQTSSKIKFIPFLDLKQNAIPTSNRSVENGDKFLLNYLYDFSLLIAPNSESFKIVRKKFRNNAFIHSDIFAAYLKFIYRPHPTKEIIQDFALSQNMGTLFFVIETNLYVVDTRTFTILDKRKFKYVEGESQMPFYTRVEGIKNSLFTQDYTKWLDLAKKYLGEDNKTEDEIIYGDLATDKKKDIKLDYTAYYKKLLGV